MSAQAPAFATVGDTRPIALFRSCAMRHGPETCKLVISAALPAPLKDFPKEKKEWRKHQQRERVKRAD